MMIRIKNSPWVHAAALALCCVSVADAFAETSSTKPNVIMIFTDDMGYGDISSFSNSIPVGTPNIDRLATEGMKFTHFYVAMPICSPSRAAVLSGRFSPETGITTYLQSRSGNVAADQNDYMDPAQSFLPKVFQGAGYATAHVGKWHLGGGRDIDDAPSISEYGYDEAYSTWESPNPDPKLGIKYAPWDDDLEPGQVERYDRTKYMVDKTLEILQRKQGQPCFITLWPDDLHTPFWPSPAMRAKWGGSPTADSGRKNFYAVLDEYDIQIGRLLDGITAQGLDENTIIFFTGDNGPAPRLSGDRTNGMRGQKSTVYEGGIREPFLIRWPGHIPAGATNSQTVLNSVDLLPTLAALADIDLPTTITDQIDGEDLSAAMLGTPVVRSNPLMWEFGRPSGNPHLAIRDGDFKLLVHKNDTDYELYNVRTDPNEATNLANQNGALVQSMAATVKAWSASLVHRTHPNPIYSQVNFNQYTVATIASESALRIAAGAADTAQINGVSAAPNPVDDIYVVHTDSAGKDTFLSIDADDGAINKITDSLKVAQDLGALPGTEISLRAGFEYSPGGNRLFLAEDNLAMAGQALVISVDVGTGQATLVRRNQDIGGLADFSIRQAGAIAGVRGIEGNSSIGFMETNVGSWVQKISEANLLSQSAGATELPPQSIAVNFVNGQSYTFSGGDRDLFFIPDVNAGSPVITRQTQAGFQPVDFVDLSVDHAGNLFGYDQANASIVAMRNTDKSIYTVPLTEITQRLGGANPLVPVAARGISARMADSTHADIYIASSAADYGIVRVRFGTVPAAVNEWSLY